MFLMNVSHEIKMYLINGMNYAQVELVGVHISVIVGLSLRILFLALTHRHNYI